MRSAWTLMAIVATSGCTTVENNYYGTSDAASDTTTQGSIDAPAGLTQDDPMSCGHSLPMTAVPTVRIVGHLSEVSSLSTSPVASAGALVELFRRGVPAPIASTVTLGDGTFSLAAQTNAVPVDGFLRFHKTGFVDTFHYPAVPWVKDATFNDEVLMTTSVLDSMRAASGAPATTGTGLVVAAVVDCADQPLLRATLTVVPAEGVTVTYPSTSGTTASSTTEGGLGLINMPAGNARIDGTAPALELRGHTVEARANVFTIANVSP